MNSRNLLIVGILALSLSGCSALSRFGPGADRSPDPKADQSPSPSPSPSPTDTPPPSGPGRGDLDGRQFLSTLVTRDGKTYQLATGTRIRLTFDADKLGAPAGCNLMSGDYRLDGSKLVVGMMSMTEMACDEPRMAQDAWLADFLASRPTITLDGNELLLATDTTSIQLLDREIAEPDQPLVGITWGLTTLIDGDVASSLPDGLMATILFRPDGQVEVYTGCNSGGGPYTLDGNQIHLEQLVMTLMACPGAAGEADQAVRQVLGAGTVTYSIDAASLTLEADGHGLQLSAAIDL